MDIGSEQIPVFRQEVADRIKNIESQPGNLTAYVSGNYKVTKFEDKGVSLYPNQDVMSVKTCSLNLVSVYVSTKSSQDYSTSSDFHTFQVDMLLDLQSAGGSVIRIFSPDGVEQKGTRNVSGTYNTMTREIELEGIYFTKSGVTGRFRLKAKKQ